MTFALLTLDDIDPNWAREPNPRWRVGAALGTAGGMAVPVSRIFVHHTVSADTGDVIADVAGPCDTDQRNFGKVSYSWNIHESTNSVVEVEGTHRGAHTINNAQQSLNGISFGFGVIGNFHPSAPNPAPREPSDALLALIAEAIRTLVVDQGLAAPGYTIEGHRDAPYATACCGDSLYAKLPIIRALVSSPPTPPPLEDDVLVYTYVKKPNSGDVFVARHGEKPEHVGAATFGFEAAEAMVRYQGDHLVPSADGQDVPDALGVVRKVLTLNSVESQQWFGI